MCNAVDAGAERKRLNFSHLALQRFAFMADHGYRVAGTELTIVRFQKDDLVAAVYHGRSSYEVGFEIGRGDEQFSLSGLIRAVDADAAARYRNPVATTPSALAEALELVAELVERYGQQALAGDAGFFQELRHKRRTWTEEYALDVLADQVRPRAEAAFREGRYREAAELYERMSARLTPAEQKKLSAARKRS